MASPELVEAVAEVKSATDSLAEILKKGLPKPPYVPIELLEAMPQLEKVLTAVARVKELVGEVTSEPPSGRMEDLADKWFNNHQMDVGADETDHRTSGPAPSPNDGGSYSG